MFFNFNCVILDVVPVVIGSHVLFGPGVQVYTATHPMNAAQRGTDVNPESRSRSALTSG